MPWPPQLQNPEGQRLLTALRKATARLPQVEEVIDGFGHTTFKVAKKSFVIAGMGEDAADVAIKADHDTQAHLIRRGPFFRTPYIGQHGWVSVTDPLSQDWAEIEELIVEAYRLTAPKRLVKQLQIIRACLPLFLTAALTTGAYAQENEDRYWSTKPWVGEVTFLGVNSLVAGLTAGIVQELRDGSFQDGFAKGALGGAIAYGGRRIAIERFDGAGLLGRQVGAVGASMTRNAGEGRALLSRLHFPIGPLSIDVVNDEVTRVTPRLNLFASGWLITALLDDRMALDARASLSAGTPVFRAPDYRLNAEDGVASGVAWGGVILIAHEVNPGTGDVFSHERVHVLQTDFAQIVWGDPVEQWLGDRVPYGRRVLRYVQPGIAVPALYGGLVRAIDYTNRPWEIEAEFLGGR